MIKQVNPGDIKVYKAELFSTFNGASLDISPQIRSLSIFESIFQSTVGCELLMEDSLDLHKNFPIIGEEYFTISFKTPGVEDITTYKFNIVNTVAKSDQPNKKVSTYILKGISEEFFTSIKVGQYTYSYQLQIHDIIKRLLSDVLRSNKKFYYENTKGINTLVIPNIFVFQAIDLLRRRAVSPEVPNSSFVFYENQRGFHFRTIESLIYTQRNDYGSKVFTYDNTSTMPDKQHEGVQFRNMLLLQKKNIVSTISNVADGGYINNVNAFDIITKQYESNVFKAMTKPDQFIASDQKSTFRNSQQFLASLNPKPETHGRQFWVPKDSSKVNEFLPDALGNKIAYGVMFGDSPVLDTVVFGDSSLTVGETVKLNIKNNSGLTERPSDESKLSGMYLITGLRHIISPGPADPLHHTAFEMVKMGYSV